MLADPKIDVYPTAGIGEGSDSNTDGEDIEKVIEDLAWGDSELNAPHEIKFPGIYDELFAEMLVGESPQDRGWSDVNLNDSCWTDFVWRYNVIGSPIIG